MAKRSLLISFGLFMTVTSSYGQSLLSARGMALGAYGASVRDIRSFESNPAGIVNMRDWDFATSTYTTTTNAGFVFQSLGLGKRFLGTEAIALSYAPGASLDFVLPSITVTNDSGVPATIQQDVMYSEEFVLAYAHKFSDDFSVGITGRARSEKVNDTKYEFISQGNGYSSKITPRNESAGIFAFDLGVMWKPQRALNIGVVGRNLLAIEGSLPSDLQLYKLPVNRSVDMSARFSFSSYTALALSANSQKYGAIGTEITPGQNLAFRGSVYFNKSEASAVYAFSIGMGWMYEFMEVDAAYLRFFGTGNHSGSSAVTGIDPSLISNLDLNPFSADRLMVSIKATFGNVRESLASIKGVEILSGVYPSSYELFAFRPIGKVRVKNISDKPIQAKASFFVEKYMDAPTESPSITLMPSEEADIPFNAVLNDQVKSVSTLTIREGNVYVSAATAEGYDDRFQTKILIHGRNDWDGDARSLRHFVTPDDPDILRYSRDILLQNRDSLNSVPREMESFVKARLLFNAFAGNLVYVGDPKQSSDYVQYPVETISMRSGDCDDMTTCFSSLLSSIGISTAFVDVVPPQAPEKSHIYMMFDTGLDPKLGNLISENPKRYVVRKNPQGHETIWVPIETTVITKGFSAAWSNGAQEYLDDVEIHLGVIKGWVKIIDVN